MKLSQFSGIFVAILVGCASKCSATSKFHREREEHVTAFEEQVERYSGEREEHVTAFEEQVDRYSERLKAIKNHQVEQTRCEDKMRKLKKEVGDTEMNMKEQQKSIQEMSNQQLKSRFQMRTTLEEILKLDVAIYNEKREEYWRIQRELEEF